MGAIAIGLSLSANSIGQPEARLVIDMVTDGLVGLPVQGGWLTIEILAPAAYQGVYQIQANTLEAGPVNLRPAQIAATADQSGAVVSVPGLWTYADTTPVPTRSYQWQRESVDINGATGGGYSFTATDSLQMLRVAETITDVNGAATLTSNAVLVPDLFALSLETGGLLSVINNDGRNFTLDDPSDVYDGTYTIPAGTLTSGAIALRAPVLGTVGTAQVGDMLPVTPTLFAYDPALGVPTLSYSAGVDASDPLAPTYTVQPNDAGTTLTITATVNQGGLITASTTNGIAVDTPPAVTPDLTNVSVTEGTPNDTLSITVLDTALGPVYTGIYTGTVAASSMDAAALRTGTDTGQVGSATLLGTLTAGSTGFTDVPIDTSGLTAGNTYTVAVELNGEVLADTFTANAQPSTFTHALVLTQELGGAGTTKTLVLPDLTAYTDPKIYVALGDNRWIANQAAPVLSEHTLDGTAATGAWTTAGNTSAFFGRMSVLEFTVAGAGPSAGVVSTVLSADRAANAAVFVVEGGQLDDVSGAQQFGSNTINLTVTPAAANNVVLAVAIGDDEALGTPDTWVGMTELTNAVYSDGNTVAAATVEDVAGAFTVTRPSDSTNNIHRWGAIALAFSERV